MVKAFLIAALALVSFHPLHISVTEIEYDQKEWMLKIMMRVFVDDFETTMGKKLANPDLDVRTLGEEQIDKLVTEYVKEHFKLVVDGKPVNAVYLGHEIEAEAFIFYVEVTGVKKFTTIQISNDMMMESFEDQSNLVHVSINEKIKSLRLTKDLSTDKLSFDSK